MEKQAKEWSAANARLEYNRNYKELREAKRNEYMEKETCENCGSTEHMEFHHVIPVIFRGNNKLSNFKRLCKGCHSKLHWFNQDESVISYNPFDGADLNFMFSEFMHVDCDNCSSNNDLKLRMVVPVAAGGQHVKGNFATLCTDCNQILDDNTNDIGILYHSTLIKVGQTKARKDGKHMGRPSVDDGIKKALVVLYMLDVPVKKLATRFNYAESTIYRYKRRFDNLYDLEKTSDTTFTLIKKANGDSKDYNLYKNR